MRLEPVAVIHEQGLGVVPDPVWSYVYYSLAAAQGDPEAQFKRDRMRRELDQEERTLADRRIAERQPKN